MVGWDNMPRSLRLFNIRFRLALDLQIDFEGGRAMVKSKGVKAAYQSLYRLVDMFNAYEAYVSYQKDVHDRFIPKGRVQDDRKNRSAERKLRKTGADQPLLDLYKAIQEKANTKEVFKRKFESYLEKVLDTENVKGGMRQAFLEIQGDFKANRDTRVINILALIYGERNLFYHNGEAAIMGMTYVMRKWLLDKYREALIQVLLNNICYQLREEMQVMMN